MYDGCFKYRWYDMVKWYYVQLIWHGILVVRIAQIILYNGCNMDRWYDMVLWSGYVSLIWYDMQVVWNTDIIWSADSMYRYMVWYDGGWNRWYGLMIACIVDIIYYGILWIGDTIWWIANMIWYNGTMHNWYDMVCWKYEKLI